ncbi:methyltransferase [Streptomyces sp. B1866]|uniref:HemK2/MTQ2 family protein methyltransferase n=1 Tax=Streptomyces sp. B1866 TaxID=3075431 RepID=UPI00288E8C38|nr:HemK2/MTQ2 family protein methyltransferase [Streptomyces sp. B1866]MDT3400616.1 methyltransferase [Streptomyces sp. B1866]
MRMIRPPGVYAPQGDTALLAEAVRREARVAGSHVLDVGTGTGALAILAARCGAARVDAVDISPSAVLAARLNARLSGLPVRVRRGGLPRPAAGRRFDVIVANPPYVPSLLPLGHSRRWNGGPDGRAVLDVLCARAPRLLRPRGVLLVVHSGLCGVDRTLRDLAGRGLRAEVAARSIVPFGPVLRGSSPWLASQGLIAPGEDKEELVVIRALRA